MPSQAAAHATGNGGILNSDPRQRGVFRPVLYQLQQGFHGAQRAKTGVGGDIHATGIDRERIALMLSGSGCGFTFLVMAMRMVGLSGLTACGCSVQPVCRAMRWRRRLTASPRSSPVTLTERVLLSTSAPASRDVQPSQARASGEGRLPERQTLTRRASARRLRDCTVT